MSPRSNSAFCFLGLLLVLGVCGCQTTGAKFLNLIGVQREPVTFALVIDSASRVAAESINPFSRYAALQESLAETIGRPVTLEPCFPFQAGVGLENGWYCVAVMTPAHYAALPHADECTVLAVEVGLDGSVLDEGVMIVERGSASEAVEDVRGETVAFGPQNDTYTHHAALALLQEHGLEKTDLALSAVPFPGSLKHYPHMRGVAQATMNQSVAAGFVTRSAWEQLPEHAEGADEPARDRLRAVAATKAYPRTLIVASPKMDEATRAAIRDFLLEVGQEQPEVVEPIGIQGYAAADEMLVARCRDMQLADVPSRPERIDEGAESGESSD